MKHFLQKNNLLLLFLFQVSNLVLGQKHPITLVLMGLTIVALVLIWKELNSEQRVQVVKSIIKPLVL